MSDAPSPLRSGFVALVGWTNVGKSTLLNRLVGTKLAAVADVAQTTRHRILGALSCPLRGQIVFIDTPGLHEPRHRMNHAMVHAARQVIGEADVVALVIDASRGPGPGDRKAARALADADVQRLALLNKVDRVQPKTKLLPMMQEIAEGWGIPRVVPISATTGDGCDELVDELFGLLPESAPLYPDDFLTDQPQRELAAEWIREKILHHTREELPHATAVTIERWSERDNGLIDIDATVYVERDSQKAIVIGKQGDVLKRVGSEARVELEELLEQRVFLRLWVKVKPGWRDDKATLRELGLS